MKYNLKYYGVVLAVVLTIIWGSFSLVSAETTKVIGECTIQQGVQLRALIAVGPDQVVPGGVKSFEEQKAYILVKNDQNQLYGLDLQGFVHDCPTHGREELSNKGIILVPYDQEGVECTLFEE